MQELKKEAKEGKQEIKQGRQKDSESVLDSKKNMEELKQDAKEGKREIQKQGKDAKARPEDLSEKV